MTRIRWTLLGVMGLASFMTGQQMAHHPLLCPHTALIACQTVLTGPGHLVLGVPLTVWALVWATLGWFRPSGVWRSVGLAGLLWAWGHEIGDGRLCLWCTALQLLILLALWPRIAGTFWKGWWHDDSIQPLVTPAQMD